jgi:hypothetical protein
MHLFTQHAECKGEMTGFAQPPSEPPISTASSIFISVTPIAFLPVPILLPMSSLPGPHVACTPVTMLLSRAKANVRQGKDSWHLDVAVKMERSTSTLAAPTTASLNINPKLNRELVVGYIGWHGKTKPAPWGCTVGAECFMI